MKPPMYRSMFLCYKNRNGAIDGTKVQNTLCILVAVGSYPSKQICSFVLHLLSSKISVIVDMHQKHQSSNKAVDKTLYFQRFIRRMKYFDQTDIRNSNESKCKQIFFHWNPKSVKRPKLVQQINIGGWKKIFAWMKKMIRRRKLWILIARLFW